MRRHHWGELSCFLPRRRLLRPTVILVNDATGIHGVRRRVLTRLLLLLIVVVVAIIFRVFFGIENENEVGLLHARVRLARHRSHRQMRVAHAAVAVDDEAVVLRQGAIVAGRRRLDGNNGEEFSLGRVQRDGDDVATIAVEEIDRDALLRRRRERDLALDVALGRLGLTGGDLILVAKAKRGLGFVLLLLLLVKGCIV